MNKTSKELIEVLERKIKRLHVRREKALKRIHEEKIGLEFLNKEIEEKENFIKKIKEA